MQAYKLEERWTPTTIHATFALRDLPSTSHGISIPLPLLNLGWTFALSLTRKRTEGHKTTKKIKSKQTIWVPAAFSFRQHDRKIPWGNTSMHAQLLLAPELQYDGNTPSSYEGEHNGINNDLVGTIDVILAHTPSAELPLATSYTLLSHSPTKVWLTVTIQECPFVNGFFQALSNHGNETEAQLQLVRQSGDRVLSRSLTTGKHFDVQFLSCSTRSASESFGKPLPTYASLSVLEKSVNFRDAKLSKEWTSALAALKDHDSADSSFAKEISCPDGVEYELLDSDYEDDEEASFPVELGASSLPCVPDPAATLKGKQPESSVAGSSSSCSSFVLDGASDQDSVDHQPDEGLNGLGGSPHLFSVATVDHERTILVKFAAHRTWHAFLWYCYTGHVEFNGLKSQVQSGVRRVPLTHLIDAPPSCSPKSMYRLADLVGKEDLKAKALEAIKDRMTEANVLEETFSVFTSRYPDVREVQLSALMERCGSPEVKKAFLKTMQKYSNMPHAEPVLSAFYDQLVA